MIQGLTGAEAIATLRQRWGLPIPAIIITGDTAPTRMREALESGVPVMHKPVLPDDLHRELSRLLSQ